MKYWLMKSEPDECSIDDVLAAPKRVTPWSGVRNYQARNFMLKEMQVGDGVLFYHSSAKPPAAAGTATVTRAASPDPTQFDAKSDHHDPAASREAPRWYGVHITLDRIFARPLPADELRSLPALADMVLFRRSRLSVQPVTAGEWRAILALAGEQADRKHG
jgi:predicted RNA-binding protein with PUA-like domain